MNYRLLNLGQKKEWNTYFEKLPINQQDVYLSSEYYEIFEIMGQGKSKCFVFEMNGQIALYPFIMNSVNKLGYELDEEYFDIQGVYGYNGVSTTTYDNNFIITFFNVFTSFCKKENIIAEFLRYNPIIENHKFSIGYNITNINQNIVLDLNIEDIWMKAYEHSTRKNIKNAIRNNLKVIYFSGTEIPKEYIIKFHEVYSNTMQRNSANKFFFFDIEHFQNMANNLKDNAIFLFTFKEGVVISCELVLCGGEICYSFLGGTNSEYYKYRPNDILKHKIIELLKIKKYKYYCLGGGTKPNDGIFNYKSKFAKNGTYNFYIGKKIHNQKIYNEIIKQWEHIYSDKHKINNNKILGYREI